MSEHKIDWKSVNLNYARNEALEQLELRGDCHPRSRAQETKNAEGRVVDEDDVPTIAGYEALELEGLAIRLETVLVRGEERVHFRLKFPEHPRDKNDGGEKSE